MFRRRRFFEGRPIFGSELSDIGWFRPDGGEMTPADWNTGFSKSLGAFLNGDALPDPDPEGTGCATTRSCGCSTRTTNR